MAKTIISLFIILVVGAYLRFVNISPYKYYPDSYQNLIVAKNITTYNSVAGALGDDGAPYPQYFMWSRPIYPVFINLANLFTVDLTKSAQTVSYIFGVLTIVLVYTLTRQIFKSNLAGLLGAALAATSFNYTVWSGFIMSDTTGIFFLVLFLNYLFYTLPRKSNFADLVDLLTGAVFSLAVFSRYEYLIFCVTVMFLMLVKKVGKEKLVNIFIGFLIATAIIFSLLFPFVDTLRLIFGQTQELMLFSILAFFALPLIYKYLYPLLLKQSQTLSMVFLALAFFALLLKVLNFQIPVLVGFGNFAQTDFVIFTLGFVGISYMLKSKSDTELSFFLLISILIMEIVYFKINPLQQRYHSHILIFLIIPAVYVLNNFSKTFRFSKYWIIGLFVYSLIIQMNLTYYGMRLWHNGDWFKESYEEVSAKTLKTYLRGEEVLISAMPEAYFYFTNNSTRGLTDESPYFYIDDLSKDQELIIVSDMATRNIFPNFSKYLQENYQNYKVNEYKTSRNFRYRYNSEKEIYPIEVYKLKGSDF